MSDATVSRHVQSCLDRLRADDQSAYDELWGLVNSRLIEQARRMKLYFPSVAGWTETADVAQNAVVRLLRALQDAVPATPRDFYGLANLQIRRELLDVIRQIKGRSGARIPLRQFPETMEVSIDTHHPADLAIWEEFHVAVAELPEVEREAFELWWYQELTHEEIAELLGVDKSTVKRRCRAARGKLSHVLAEPGDGATDVE